MRSGVIGPKDIAPLVKLSPQAVHKWAVQAKIDLTKARAKWARECWQEAKQELDK